MTLDEMTDSAIDYILDGLESERRLTKWEQGFVGSLREQWDSRRSLSEKQKEVLGRLWDKF